MDARTKFDPKTDLRSGFPRFSPENSAANTPVVDLLKRFAKKKNATPAQNCPGMAIGTEAVDRADPGHTQHRTPERELGGSQCSADVG